MSLRRTTNSRGVADDAFRLKPIARSVQLALLPGLFIGLSPDAAQAAPAGGEVQAGQGYINQNATKSVTSIYQGSQRLAIDWQSFNVKPHELVQFHQPNARASALNRIFDQRPSEIFGRVKANGQVVLLNPNGVFFKPGAEVNVGSLIAGAMQIGIDDFMSGNYKLKALEGAEGRVVNQGRIEAAPGGDVSLVGKSIANQGVIVATAGRVNLVAGEQVTVDFEGDGLLKFTVDKAVIDNATVLDDQISNTGDIIADGGDVLITASAADGVFKNAINNGGAIAAARIDKSGGSVRLVGMGPSASVLNTGRINASAGTATDNGGSINISGTNVTHTGELHADSIGATGGAVHLESSDTTTIGEDGLISVASSGGDGGRAQVLGEQVHLTYNASIDASGETGGGDVLIGGDYQGGNPEIRNADTTFVSSNATVTADAESSGDGGKVIVWADDSTYFYGDISATGGEQSGDGGFAEVSGKENLLYRGHTDLKAPQGQRGTLLLDPVTLTVIDATAGGEEDGNLPTITAASNLGGVVVNTVSWGQIALQGANADVLLQASGLVTVDDVAGMGTAGVTDVVAGEIHLPFDAGGGAGSLTIESTTGNVVFTNTANVIVTEAGNVTILATAGTATVGGIRTSGAADNLSAGAGAVAINSGTGGSIGSIVTDGATATITVGAGTMTQTGLIADSLAPAATVLDKQGAGTLTLSLANTYTGATTVTAGTLNVSNAAGLGTAAAGTTVADGATLNLDLGVGIGAEAITVQGTGVGAAGALQASVAGSAIAGGVTLLGDTSFGGTGGLAFVGVINDGASSFSIEKVGGGTVQLEAANTYDGTTTVTAGTLAVTHQTALGSSGGGVGVDGTTVAADARLTFAIVTPQTVSEELSITGDGPGTSEALLHSTANTLTLDGGITLAGDAVISASAGTGFLNVDGIISGATFGIDKQGAGTVVLNAANTYTGTTTVTLGTLQLGTAGERIADASRLVVNGGTFDMNSLGETVASLAGIGGAVDSAGAAILVSGGDNTSTNFAGSVNGLVALTKIGTGNLTLSGANAYLGVTNVNAGVLTADNNLALGAVGGATIGDGDGGGDATLAVAAGRDIGTEGLTLNGAGTGNIGALKASGAGAIAGGAITLGGASSLGADAASSLRLDGAITGAVSLSKVGTGTVELNANNAATFTSTIDVTAGTLTASMAGALGDTGAGTTVTAGALNINNVNIGMESLTINGAGVSSMGALQGTGLNAEVDGTVTLASAASIGGTGTLQLDGVITSTVVLSKVDSGTLNLTADNSMVGGITGAGSTIAVNGGTLIASNNGALGDTMAGTDVGMGDTLEIAAGIDIGLEALSLDGGTLAANGAGAISSGAISLTADSIVGGAGTLDIFGIISGGFGIDKQDAGNAILHAANAYTGTTTVTAGILRLATAAERIANASDLVVNGGTFDMNGFSETVATLTGVGGIITSAAGTPILNTDGASTYAGNITGTMGLNKTGPGTLTLSGNNTYSGTTTVAAGILQAGSGTAFGDTSDVTLSGGTLDINDQTEVVGSIGGGSGTLHLGAGAGGGDISAAGNIDLTGVTVTTAGGGNDRIASGMTLTTDAIAKADAGNLNLGGSTLIDLNGTISVSSGSLVLEDATVNAMGDLTANGTLDLSGITLTLDGGSQLIDAGTGALTTDGFTKANAGDVTLGGDGGVDINGAVDVTMGSLILADNANVVGNLDALTNITFQGGGNTTFDGGAINQTVTAMNGTITDTTGVLVKGGANDLILVAGTNVGTGTGNRLGLNVSGGVQASALASNIFMESAVALTINALVTGPGADIVDIRTTAGTASLTMVGGYTAVLGDAFTLLAQGDLNFTTNTLTVATMAASFGQGGGASIDVDVLVDGTTDFTITGGGGVDTIDLAGLAAVFDFTATGAGTGSIDTPVAMGLEVSLYSAIENITSGSAATDSFSDNTAYVITGANTGTASSLNLGAGVWTGIEELFGTAGAADTLSGSTAYVLTGTNAGTATNLTVGWSLIENLVGNINPSDTLSGSDVYTITGADTGTATGTFNITGTWSGIENLFGTAGSGAFNVNNGGSLSGAIADAGGTDVLSYAAKTDANVTVTIEAGFFSAAATAISGGGPSSVLGIEEFVGSGAAGNDTFTGRNEIATWDIDGAGGNETVTDATSTTTYSGFEILQGGSMVDEFDVTDDVTFAELRGGGGNDIFDIDDGPGVGTVVTADLFGEAGDDVVQFGPPGGPPAVGEDSRVVGMVDLGPGAADEIDLSGSELVEIIAITGSDANGNMGTITGFGDPDLISGGFAGVNVLTGNGLGTFIGPPGDTFWDINATDSGTFGGGLGTIGAMVYSGVSILAGAGADTFIFTGTGEVTQGIDGGGGFNTVMGGIGADTFTVLGATSVDFLFGGNTTSLTNITHIDSTAGAGTFDDIGGDTVALGGNTWGGDINGGAGSDTLSGSDNYTITGADLGTSTNVLGAGGWSMIENLDATGGMDTFTVTTGSLSGTADGLGNTDTLTGNATYTISGGDSGTASSVAVWQAIENLTGTGGMDAFNVTTGSLSGTADGLGNTDTLTGNTTYTISGADSGTSSAVGVWTAIENLSGTVGMDTFNVTTGSLSGTADGLGGVTDVLTGNTSYAITGANSGTASAVAVWTAIENVTGTGGVDMFTFSAAGSLTGSASGLGGGDVYAMNVTSSAASLDGGDGNDMFTIASGVTFSGAVNGDGDNDTLTLTDGTSMLTGSFAGGGTGTDMDVLIGSTGYTISGVDSGTALQVSGTFSEIENLTGTGGMDAFNVTTGSLSGTADGLGNTDTLTGNTTYTISGADSGTSSAVGVWTAIENLSGTVGMDTFTVTTGTLSGTADGLGNTDTLTGNTTYTISGGDSGTSSSVAVWQNIENLTGTGGMDAFNVTTGSLSGTADGLGNTDTLTGNTTYTISGGDSGTASAVGVWTAIENLTGTGGMDTFAVTTGSLSGTADGLGSMDTLSGNTTYTISGGDSGTASSVAVWTAIENLTGTGLDDVFTVTTGTLSGTINGLGPAASDRLEGDTSFTVNGPNAGFSASVAAFINIEDLRATGGADTFNFLAGGSITGDAEGLGAGDTFNIAATSAAVQLIGGAGDDIFNISGGAGTTFTGNIEGGLGSDTLNLGTPTVPPPAGPDRSTIIGDVNLGIEVGETDTIDMSGSDLFQLVDAQDPGMNNEQTGTITGTGPDIGIDMISGTFSGVESFMGNGKGTLIGPNNDTWWQITASDTGTFGNSLANIGVNAFTNFNILGGSGADVVVFDTASSANLTGGSAVPFMFVGFNGGGGSNTLIGSIGADNFTIQGPLLVDYTTPDGAQTRLSNIDDIQPDAGLPTFVDIGDDVFVLNVTTWAGSLNGGMGSDTIAINGASNDTATITTIDPASLTSAVNNFTGVGGFTGIETLNTGLGNDTITLAVASADPTIPSRNQLNLGGGVDTITTPLATDWLITGNGAGSVRDILDTTMSLQFSGVDNLTSTAGTPSNLTMPSTVPTAGSISGAFTAAAGVTLTPGPIFVGNLNDFRINGPVIAAGTTAIVAFGANDIDINGGLTLAAGNFTSITNTGTAFYHDVYTAGNQTYSGPTEFAAGGLLELADGRTTARSLELATLRGANLTFNGPTNIVGQVLMESSTNRFDFDAPAGQVTSASDAVLGLLPTPATDLFFDLVPNMPGHINSNSFGAFQGTFCGGCEFLPNPTDPTDTFNGALTQVNADYIGIAQPFMTSGNIVMAEAVSKVGIRRDHIENVSQRYFVAVHRPRSRSLSIDELMEHFLKRPVKPPVKLWKHAF